MSIGFAIIVGVLIWVPSMFILGGSSLGPAIQGAELLVAGAPVAFIGGLSLWRAGQSGNTAVAAWVVALAPLLAIAGLITSSIASRLIFGAAYHASKDLLGALVSAIAWAAVAVLWHFVDRRPGDSPSIATPEQVKILRRPGRW